VQRLVQVAKADDDARTAWDDFLPKNGDSLLSLTSAQRQHLRRKLEQEETILRPQAERLEAKRGTQQADSLRQRAEAAHDKLLRVRAGTSSFPWELVYTPLPRAARRAA
jgi:hypothetical protein